MRARFALALLLLAAACASSPSPNDPRITSLEAHAKIMMISEAAEGLYDQFGVTLDPNKTRLVVGAEVEQWFTDHHRPVRSLPEPYRAAILRGQQTALILDDALPTKSGGTQSVLYLRPTRFGIHRLMLLSQPDPCSDGNPAMCERCTGCSGVTEPGGTIKTCVCTLSCDDCVPCPPC